MEECYVCKKDRPCCGGPVHLLRDGNHKGHTVEAPELREEWGLGRVLKNCQGYEGEYRDVETGSLRSVFLGRTREKASQRMNHVKSFLW